jgi:hypothetical protein
MSKNRVLYNCQALYVGPSPATGYHFINGIGQLNNNFEYDSDNFNLIKRLNRVTDLNYSITLPREEIKQMGRSALASVPVINSPSVQVDFEYYLNGITNEARMGFNVNHPYIDELRSGEAIYSEFNTFLFSGLSTYDENIQPDFSPFWPGSNRSNRNIFAIITKVENEDEIVVRNTLEEGTSYRDGNVISFGDGYMVSYDTSCSVGSTPKAKTSFICDNVIFYTGSSGVAIPSVNAKTLENYSGIKFVIPEEVMINDVSIILPGDILVDIQQTGDAKTTPMNNITDLGAKFSDIKIQDYNISIRFDREDMNSIGYRAPASRRINFPIQVNLSFNNLVGDESEGQLQEIIREDKKYNITIRMKDRFKNQELVRYDFKNASLKDFGYTASIQDNRQLSFNFRVNCAPDNLNEGFFMSGILSSARATDYLLDQNILDYLTTENNERIITNFIPIY